ncbi:MAG TPA: hypothetical protein VJH95_00705 [Candidatus Nanoarchaeia archaeon]|nr:hypothetical protein [Candidatus Nanoarchaeia archaeon]
MRILQYLKQATYCIFLASLPSITSCAHQKPVLQESKIIKEEPRIIQDFQQYIALNDQLSQTQRRYSELTEKLAEAKAGINFINAMGNCKANTPRSPQEVLPAPYDILQSLQNFQTLAQTSKPYWELLCKADSLCARLISNVEATSEIQKKMLEIEEKYRQKKN